MKILQKIIATLLLSIFISFSTGIVNASLQPIDITNYSQTELIKNIISAKAKLTKIKNGNEIITKIDKIMEKIGTDKKKLQKLQSKLYEIENKLYKKNNISKYKNYFVLINYINAKIKLELYKLKQIQKEELKSKLDKMLNGNISEKDKKKIENELVKIQLAILKITEDKFDTLIKDFDKLTNYEQKGNLKMNFNLDHELVGKIKSEIELQNYTTKNSGFDSEFSGKVKALVEASLKGEEEFKVEFNTFLDFISKDGNMYILLNKLNIINESNNKQIKETFEIMRNIAVKNKYIEIEDKNTKQILEQLKNINPSKIFTDAKITLEKPLFTTYKKENNKFYLIPTKYACDKYKEISARFDPWNGNTCSDSQYEKMLKELAKTGDLYIELGNKNKLSFVAYQEYNITSFNSYIVFTDKNIEELHSKLVAKQPGEGFELTYFKGNKLNLFAKRGDLLNIDFKSELTNDNKFKSIDLKYNTKGFNDKLKADLQLKNKQITGKLNYDYNSYAGYDSKSYTSKYDKNNLNIKIAGTQDYNYNLNKLNINLISKNIDKNQDNFVLNFDKNSDNYILKMQGYNDGKNVLNSNIKLQNKIINGKIIIYKNGKEYIKITSTGKYDTKYLQLNNKIELSESPIEIFNGQTSKARDTVRIYDLKALEASIEQYYQDYAEYPTTINGNKDLLMYMYKLPKDPLGNVEINGCKFGYYYEVGKDINGIDNGSYKLSTCLENGEKYKIGFYSNDFITDKGFYINDYKTWTIQKKEKKLNAESNINFSYDIRNNKNNSNIYINYSENKNNILELNIENKGTIQYKKNLNISIPQNTMKLDEALDKKY